MELPDRPRRPRRRLAVIGVTVFVVVAGLATALWVRPGRLLRRHAQNGAAVRYPPPSDFDPLAYAAPDPVPEVGPRTHYPPRKELLVSGANDPQLFDPDLDLIEYHDPTIWWESDNDTDGDTEDDHQMHRDLLPPLLRLSALVLHEQALLKVQDSYRPTGIHNPQSLHREGRAIDLTADGMTLGRLARLAVQAGFDWVYYESPRSGGAHVHGSVRRRTHRGLPRSEGELVGRRGAVLADSVLAP